MRNRSAGICGFFLLFLAARSDLLIAEDKAAADVPKIAASIERGDLISIPVEIDGTPRKFVVASWGKQNLVDQSIAESLQRVVSEKPTAADANQAVFCRAQSASLVEGRVLLDCLFRSEDLTSFKRQAECEFDGVLRVDSLMAIHLSIDFDRRQVALGDKKLAVEGYEVFPILFFEEGLPAISLATDTEESAPFLIDLGGVGSTSSMVKMAAETFDALVGMGQIRLHPIVVERPTAKGTEYQQLGRLRCLRAGSCDHFDVSIARGGEINRVGLKFLSRYNCIFDFPEKRLYLKRRAAPLVPDRLDLSGMEIRRTSGGVAVVSVASQSPAQTAGVVAGMQIISAGDVPALQLSCDDLRVRLATPGAEIKFRVVLDERESEVLVKIPARTSESARR